MKFLFVFLVFFSFTQAISASRFAQAEQTFDNEAKPVTVAGVWVPGNKEVSFNRVCVNSQSPDKLEREDQGEVAVLMYAPNPIHGDSLLFKTRSSDGDAFLKAELSDGSDGELRGTDADSDPSDPDTTHYQFRTFEKAGFLYIIYKGYNMSGGVVNADHYCWSETPIPRKTKF